MGKRHDLSHRAVSACLACSLCNGRQALCPLRFPGTLKHGKNSEIVKSVLETSFYFIRKSIKKTCNLHLFFLLLVKLL